MTTATGNENDDEVIRWLTEPDETAEGRMAAGDGCEDRRPFHAAAARHVAAAYRGLLWRDMALLAVHAQVLWTAPAHPPAARRGAAQDPGLDDRKALNLANTLAQLGLALKRVSGKDASGAEADTFAGIVVDEIDLQFDRLTAAKSAGNRTAGGRNLEYEMQRRLMKAWPALWSEEARAEVGLPRMPDPAEKDRAARDHAAYALAHHRRHVAHFESVLSAPCAPGEPTEEKTPESDDRMGDGAPTGPLARMRTV